MPTVTDHLEATPSIVWAAASANAEASFTAPWDGWIIAKAGADANVRLWGVGLEQLDYTKAQFDAPGYAVTAGDSVQLKITGGSARAGDPVSEDCQFVPRAAAIEISEAAFSNTAPTARSIDETAWQDVKVALTSGDPAVVANGSTVDGVVLATGERFVRTGTGATVGIYQVGGGASGRASDADSAAEFDYARTVRVTHGSVANRGRWVHLTTGAITLGSTSLVMTKLSADPVPIS